MESHELLMLHFSTSLLSMHPTYVKNFQNFSVYTPLFQKYPNPSTLVFSVYSPFFPHPLSLSLPSPSFSLPLLVVVLRWLPCRRPSPSPCLSLPPSPSPSPSPPHRKRRLWLRRGGVGDASWGLVSVERS